MRDPLLDGVLDKHEDSVLVRLVSDEKLVAPEFVFPFDFVFQLRKLLWIELIVREINEEKSIRGIGD